MFHLISPDAPHSNIANTESTSFGSNGSTFRPLDVDDHQDTAQRRLEPSNEQPTTCLRSEGCGEAVLSTVPPLPTRNKALPDIDDVSVNHVFSYTEHYKVDLFWSFLSDSFFIAGSLAYIVLSLWDYRSQDTVETQGPLKNEVYIALDVLAPFVYLLNSVVDIEWATHVHRRIMDKHKLTQHWEEVASQYTALDHEAANIDHGDSCTPSTNRSLTTGKGPTLTSKTPNGMVTTTANSRKVSLVWCRQLRKHAAHRRTVWAALMFGLAAFLAVLAAVVRVWLAYHPIAEDSPIEWFYIDTTLDMVSDHIYMVSAIISLTGKRNRPWLVAGPMALGTSIWNDPERLEDLGDLLFLIGCLLDALLADARLTGLLYLSVLSSFLWLLDGCLYMQSDLVKVRHLRKAQADGIDVTSAIV